MSFYIGREASKLWKRFCSEITTEIKLLAENWKYILGGLIGQWGGSCFPYVTNSSDPCFRGEVHVFNPWFLRGSLNGYPARRAISEDPVFIDYYRKQLAFLTYSGEITKVALMNYIHGVAARSVHYFHRPGPLLQDVGFFLLPELGPEKAYISETVFTFIFLSFLLWTFHPFILKSKKIYTVLLWCRVLAFLVCCQFLRIITFYSTQLPGPNYHCREGSKLARLPRPDSVLEIFIINFPKGVLMGCGDLIFSSHMIFSLVFVRTYQKYGTRRFIKQCAWLLVVIQSFLIIASRKHYTVDVVVAWYTVNLVVFFIDKKLPEMPDRSAAASLLPLSKENKGKEENHKLLNGSSGELNRLEIEKPN